MTDDAERARVEVIQADRDAAADYYASMLKTQLFVADCRTGARDSELASRFARHRLAFAARRSERVEVEAKYSIDERDDDMLICQRDWQFGWRCLARRPKLMTNAEWRPEAERIIRALDDQ